MPLHPTMKRRLHERLHPLIGDEEADALLDQVSPPDPITRQWLEERFVTKEWADERLVTKEWADERFVTKEWLHDHLAARLEPFVTKEWADELLVTKVWLHDHLAARLEPFVTREFLDARLEGLEGRLSAQVSELDSKMSERFRHHTYFMVGMASFVAVVSGLVEAFAG